MASAIAETLAIPEVAAPVVELAETVGFDPSRFAGSARLTPADRTALAERTTAMLRHAQRADADEKAHIEAEIVTLHLWLADSLARRFRHRGEEDDDLQQVARGGLIEAVRRFDPDHGPFLAYAVPTITGVLKRHFRDHGWLIRPPRRTQELAAEMRRQWPELVQRLGTDPTAADVATDLGQPVSAVREAMRASQSYNNNSLDAGPIGAESVAGSTGKSDLEACEARLIISEACHHLTVGERRLLSMRFFEERTQSDMAAELGTSQMQVSRLLSRTLSRLQTIIGSLETTPAQSESAVGSSPTE